ncbi:MAG: L-threonylcarbamoyladenylate synthase [Bacilli bacterium]|nr:L-threonylcarbamoyladenylate synthase [Bacilli bacterium]
MQTVVVSDKEIDKVVQALDEEQVVSFPTETVYGLAVKFNSHKALDRLMEAKDRDYSKSITLMISKKEDISHYAYINEDALKIINAFMPGKITLIFNKKENIDPYMTNGKETIGIRIPNNKYVLSLINKTGPLLVTSANLSGHINTTCTKEVLEQLNGRISLIVDGKTEGDIASTVVDLTQEEVRILRVGEITKEEIGEVLK